MLILDAEQTRQRLPYAALLPALASAAHRLAAGVIQAPERLVLPLAEGARYLAMPAADERLAIAKLITVHPGNPARGLAAIRGQVLATDARSGETLALLDGPTVTARRTAALSMLGLRSLRPGPVRRVALIGAGVQAAEHARALQACHPGVELRLSSRSADKALALTAALRSEGIAAEFQPDVGAALQGADAVITATTSRVPVLPEQVDAGLLIVAIGAFTPEMVEVPAAVVRARRLIVDTLEGARHEAGDLIQAGIDWAQVMPLAQALDAPPAGAPLIFKTVGHAAWDLAAVEVALAG